VAPLGSLLAALAATAGLAGHASQSHVVVVVMENRAYTDVIGARKAPYLNALARRSAVPARMFATTHPSLPNYLALTGGDTFGVHDNCTSCHVNAESLAVQLERAGFSWKAYTEGLPRPCYRGASAGRYVKKHNPFMYYDNIRDDPRRCARVVPLNRLAGDLRGTLPDLAWITPDLCHDMHDCGVEVGDRFAAKLVPSLLARVGPAGFLIVAWDEGRTDRGCCGGDAAGGRIATIVAGPGVARGATGSGSYDQYSILRTIEEAFGLSRLRRAGSARTRSLDSLFHAPPRISWP
jgi:phospholipase C